MGTPLQFLRALTARLSAAQVPFAVTSGMACVHYGLQQATKDVDLILVEDGIGRFHVLLDELEREVPPWRIAYRVVFGAPLDGEYMSHGWTSHLVLRDEPGSAEHHLDVFCRAPRVARIEWCAEDPTFASRHVVAMMKRTDRDRDWPIVDALGLQLREQDQALALLHVQDAALLAALWEDATPQARARAAARRPLLALLPEVGGGDVLEPWLRLERLVWETVNQERHRLYESAWKAFHRRWRADESFDWPTAERWRAQHARLSEAAGRFGLAADPVGAAGRETVYERALDRTAVRAGSTREKVERVRPAIGEVLP